MAAEVEILVQVVGDAGALIRELEATAISGGSKQTTDIYYYDPLRESLKPDVAGRLYNCLRIRNKGGVFFVTYKADHFDGSGRWTYSDEYETQIADGNILAEAFGFLGYKKLVTVRMTKTIFRTQKYEIALEDVDGLGCFLEIEDISGSPAPIPDKKKEIQDFLDSLPFKYSREFDGGKPELMLARHGIQEK